MDYSTTQIEQINELASLLTPLSDIAILLDIDVDMLRLDVLDRKTEVSKNYRKAKAKTALELRKQEIGLANVGSPLAVNLVNEYLINMDSDEDL